MITGFDYGTSNCAMGAVMQTSDNNASINLLPLDHGKAFMPSTLYALERELITEYVGLHIHDKAQQEDYARLRASALEQARRVRFDEGIEPHEQALFFGRDAFEQYLSLPEEGYFVKSPKSFLGSSGFRPEFIQFFEDIVTAMMQSIKQRAELSLQDDITHTVIGRPVNFQGSSDTKKSNQQAIEILTTAATRAGFKTIEFLFEPIAAGMDFEERLEENKTVLVVDVGGGTTDCAMVRMGPDYRHNEQRDQDFLAHSGERIGGNDLDIQLAGKHFMPLFGMKSTLRNGLDMPRQIFLDAVKTNDVGAQAKFNSLPVKLQLQQLAIETKEPELLKRFIKMRENGQNQQLVRSAEQCKIALSEATTNNVLLDYIEAGLHCDVTQAQFAEAIAHPLSRIVALMQEAITQAGCQPDLIYVTGGSAKSPAIRQAIETTLGNINVVDGDHFGSVAAGLTVWAKRIFA